MAVIGCSAPWSKDIYIYWALSSPKKGLFWYKIFSWTLLCQESYPIGTKVLRTLNFCERKEHKWMKLVTTLECPFFLGMIKKKNQNFLTHTHTLGVQRQSDKKRDENGKRDNIGYHGVTYIYILDITPCCLLSATPPFHSLPIPSFGLGINSPLLSLTRHHHVYCFAISPKHL